jgi:predicted glycosyltransferase
MHVLIWVQHLLGTGHFKRAAQMAAAIAADGLPVTLVTGGPPIDWRPAPGVELVQLPTIQARDRDLSLLVDQHGRPIDDVFWAKRRAKLMSVFARTRPRVLITEMFPFGRRAFQRELVRLLEVAAAFRPKPWILGSVRDILVEKSGHERYAWMRDMVLTHYDRILVHTDPRLVPFGLTFPHVESIASRLVNTGYITSFAAPARFNGQPEVIVSTGGGRVGAKLLQSAIGARPHTRLAKAPWRLIAGINANANGFEALRAELPKGISIDHYRRDFPALLANSLLSVSQAGYNTVVEALRFGRRMVLVPFETATETEQRVRAERLGSLGLAQTVREATLTPSGLAKAIDAALELPEPKPAAFDLDGMARTVQLVRELVAPAMPMKVGELG